MTDESEPESGPFCRHWSDPNECDATCARCGHTCREHGYGCVNGCSCEAFETESEFDATAWRRDPWVPGKRYDLQIEERGDALYAENHRLRERLEKLSSILDTWEESGCYGGPDELAELREAIKEGR